MKVNEPVCDVPRGWCAELRLRFAARAKRTHLLERHHRGPLVVQRPFYPEGDVCHAYIVHPPGGVVGGDELRIDVELQEHAHVLLTTPAAGKFYRSAGAFAEQIQNFHLYDATLEWLPQESIYYRGANVRSTTRVTLGGESRFIGWEIACLGLPAREEVFDDGALRLGFELEVEDRPRVIDRLRIDGHHVARTAAWGLAGNQAIATMLAYPAKREMAETIRDIDVPSTMLAASVVDDVLVCRVLGAQAEPVRRAMTEVWQRVRPALLTRPAVLPRIWIM
jgi:urease accessory protein